MSQAKFLSSYDVVYDSTMEEQTSDAAREVPSLQPATTMMLQLMNMVRFIYFWV